MFDAGTLVPYFFWKPGKPSSRVENSLSTQNVAWSGWALTKAATSESVLRLFCCANSARVAIAYVLLNGANGETQTILFFARSSFATASYCACSSGIGVVCLRCVTHPVPVYSQYMSISPLSRDSRATLVLVSPVLSFVFAPAACSTWRVIWPSTSCSSKSLDPTVKVAPWKLGSTAIEPPPPLLLPPPLLEPPQAAASRPTAAKVAATLADLRPSMHYLLASSTADVAVSVAASCGDAE